MKQESYERLLGLLDNAIERCGSKVEVARKIGTSAANITYWSKRQRTPTIKEFSKVLDLLDCRMLLPEELPDYVDVPKVSAKAGAGSSLVTSDEVEGFYAFRRQFLARMGIPEKKAVLLDVIGNSMAPILHDGDTILVDQSKTEPYEGYIYLVGLGDELLVKRLHRHAKGWSLISANQEYPPVVLDVEESGRLRIYGKVVWSGHVFNS